MYLTNFIGSENNPNSPKHRKTKSTWLLITQLSCHPNTNATIASPKKRKEEERKKIKKIVTEYTRKVKKKGRNVEA